VGVGGLRGKRPRRHQAFRAGARQRTASSSSLLLKPSNCKPQTLSKSIDSQRARSTTKASGSALLPWLLLVPRPLCCVFNSNAFAEWNEKNDSVSKMRAPPPPPMLLLPLLVPPPIPPPSPPKAPKPKPPPAPLAAAAGAPAVAAAAAAAVTTRARGIR